MPDVQHLQMILWAPHASLELPFERLALVQHFRSHCLLNVTLYGGLLLHTSILTVAGAADAAKSSCRLSGAVQLPAAELATQGAGRAICQRLGR